MKIKVNFFLFFSFIIIINFFIIIITEKISSSSSNSSKNLKNSFHSGLKNSMKLTISLSNLKKYSLVERLGGFPPVNLNNDQIGSGPIYAKGWSKYMSTLTKKFNTKNFNINSNVSNNNENTANKDNFYFIVTDKEIAVFPDNKMDEKSVINHLSISSLYDVDNGKEALSGGVCDLGNFKEGFCYELKGVRNAIDFRWIICSDTYEEKSTFMNAVAKLKIKKSATEPKVNKSQNTNVKILSEIINPKPKDENKTDDKSKWVVIQDWSACTLACGGGYQYKQKYCFQPKGATPCEGEAIEKRICNTHPCAATILDKPDPNVEEKILPPKVEVVQISNRKQRYEKCIIKEEDMDVIKNEETLNKLSLPVRFPSRIVLNTDSLTIYQGETVDTIDKTFNLKDLKILQILKEDPKCFEVGYIKDLVTICSLGMNTNIDPKQNVKKWIEDIIDFKTNCQKPMKKEKPNEDLINSPEVQNFIANLQLQKAKSKLSDIQQIEKDKESESMNNQMKLVQTLAWRALDKELKYEQRMEKEETMREEREREEAHKKLIQEEQKRDSLNKAIILGNEMNSKSKSFKKKLQLEKQILQIKQEVAAKIKENRKNMEERLKRMRKMHERVLFQTDQKIGDIRRSFTDEILQVEKKGDISLCRKNAKESFIKVYCDKHYFSDVYMNTDCKKKEEFCFICCQTEFGEMYLDDREVCYSKCEGYNQV